MKVLILLCHPLASSFNRKIASTVAETVTASGHTPVFHDLYRERFDPVLQEDELRRKFSLDERIQLYMDEVMDSDVLIFIHPDWWGQVPALLKGWLDRVLRPGIAFDYEGEDFLPKRFHPLLAGKRGIAYCTTDAEAGSGPHPLVTIWKNSIFGYCGADGDCRILYSTYRSTSSERKAWLDTVIDDITSLLAEPGRREQPSL